MLLRSDMLFKRRKFSEPIAIQSIIVIVGATIVPAILTGHPPAAILFWKRAFWVGGAAVGLIFTSVFLRDLLQKDRFCKLIYFVLIGYFICCIGATKFFTTPQSQDHSEVEREH
jgi:hypothetical protein